MLKVARRARLDQVVTFALAALGIAVAIGGLGLKVGSVYAPQPGFVPFIAGVAIASFSVLHLFVRSSDDLKASPSPMSVRAAALAVALVCYTVVLEWLGFPLATSLLAIAVMRLSHPQSWPRTITISAALAVTSYLLFRFVLKVDLPSGSLFSA